MTDANGQPSARIVGRDGDPMSNIRIPDFITAAAGYQIKNCASLTGAAIGKPIVQLRRPFYGNRCAIVEMLLDFATLGLYRVNRDLGSDGNP